MPEKLPHLVVRDAAGNEREVELVRTPFTLGRQSDNDLVLLDSRISRHHAQVIQNEEGYAIEDLGSRHGTYINNERITAATLLKTGDQVSLGVADGYQLSFMAEEVVLPQLLEKMGKVAETPAPQLRHLSLLLQMAQMLHRAPALEEVLTMLVDSAISLADAERGLLFIVEENNELRLSLARGHNGNYLKTERIEYSRSAIGRVMKSGREEVLLEEETTGRAAHDTAIITGGVRGLVVVPLQKHAMMEMASETIVQTAPDIVGVLYLDSRTRPTSLTGLDRQVLQTLAVEGATVIENARLFRMTREQEKIQYQLSLARDIQQSVLPRELPRGDFFELQAVTMPCQTVGGDFYDVVLLGEDRLGLIVADVSGKGLPAAMTAVMLQGAFAAVAAGDPELTDLFGRVNEFICARTLPEMYATVFYGVVGRDGKFTFVNAGHNSPFVLRANGTVDYLESSNFPCGLFASAKYNVESTQLNHGDQVLIFSDGVPEAMDARHELFGEERLKDFLAKAGGEPGLCSKVVTAVQEFVGSAPQADDLTLVVLRYVPQQ
ncbi:MAG: SpoIIE family protein phosphatase [Deltaproteobacteria bacterium]